MDDKQLAKYEVRAKIIKALAHPARLMIVDELAQNGERCVCELTEMVGSDMSTVSRHLAQLKQAGLLEDEKRGKMIFYRLRVKCLSNFFECVESVVRANAETQTTAVTAVSVPRLPMVFSSKSPLSGAKSTGLLADRDLVDCFDPKHPWAAFLGWDRSGVVILASIL